MNGERKLGKKGGRMDRRMNEGRKDRGREGRKEGNRKGQKKKRGMRGREQESK